MIRRMHTQAITLGAAALFVLSAAPAAAQDGEAAAAAPPVATSTPSSTTLDDLLAEVKDGWKQERQQNKARLDDFARRKSDQASLLAQAQATLAREQGISEQLEADYAQKEIDIATQQDKLAERLGTLGELFGVVRQVSGDTRSNVEGSLVSSQLKGDRADFLFELGKSRSLPEIADLEKLWYVLHQEMTEQGKLARYNATVVQTDGQEISKQVIRAGVFNAVAEGKYLRWNDATRKLEELQRQPGARYLDTVSPFEGATAGLNKLAIDPSRGSILGLLVQTPSMQEQLAQGGTVGYIIIGLGSLTAAMAVLRWLYVWFVGRRVAAQQKKDKADKGNPLGRVLAVYEENPTADAETLELKLDEAVMRETARIERFIWVIKVVSVVAPLMGLLGTVTGMIRTFQAITLFGTGDPKLMAGGISEALVTTMLGLIVAIPLTLLHALVAASSKRVVDVLEEQSAGIVAERAEESGHLA